MAEQIQEEQEYRQVEGTFYQYESRVEPALDDLSRQVQRLRDHGPLSGSSLRYLRNFFRVKNIYHSNAIEGNLLNLGETRLVIEQGLTITGKPLKDSLEAKNLSQALDLLEDLADREGSPIHAADIRALHAAVLSGIDDDNAGKYRAVQVEISGSKYRSPGPESVPPMMGQLADWLQQISAPNPATSASPLVLACALHAWFVYIHPFVDGNGRAARLLMNLILMRYGYPIAIITREDRQRYYDALERSQSSDLTAFIELVHESVTESIEEYEHAAEEQRERLEWARSVVSRFSERELQKAEGEYEVWKSAMELLRGYFRQTAEMLSEKAGSAGLARVYFRDFGLLEFEKFLSLRNRNSAKKTWFFRLDFRSGQRAARYLFFFGFPSLEMSHRVGEGTVSLHVAYESTPFFFERLDHTSIQNKPDLVEVAFAPREEAFSFRYRGGRIGSGRVDYAGREFFEQVVKREF